MRQSELMSNRVPRAAGRSPLVGALAIGGSTFVALTSLFVATLAFVAGAYQLDEIGLAGNERVPDAIARWWSYAVGVVVIVNGLVAARARRSPRLAVMTAAVFVVLAVITGWLFVKTW